MFRYVLVVFLFGVALYFPPKTEAVTFDLRGFAAAEALLFPEASIHPGQEEHFFSGVLEPDFYVGFDNESFLTFIPHFRYDTEDPERTHFDIRQMSYNFAYKDFEFRVGVRREFWGVVEFARLVDIINQLDVVDSPSGLEKLGQPMVNASWFTDYGVFDFYLLPWFRERTFPGKDGRVRPSIVVDTDQTKFESGAEEKHIDFAFRYFNSFKDLDLGLSYFIGTGRNPLFDVGFNKGELVLTPFYEQIRQFGIDAQYVVGNLFLKFEGIHQDGMLDDYYAYDAGIEYTIPSLFGTGKSLGILAEYLFDDRGEKRSPTEDDIGFGLRLDFNDVEGSTILGAVIQDRDTNSRLLLVQGTTRLTENIRVTAEYRGFVNQPKEDLLLDLRDDDFFNLSLTYFFNARSSNVQQRTLFR